MHGGRRLGHRPQLHRLRPARQRRDDADVRGRADLPDAGRFWAVCEKHAVNIFYTAPTAIRALMGQGKEWVEKHDLSSPAHPRLGRRADQPRGVDLVRRGGRQGPLPDRRHLVADRDRRHPDHAAARRDPDQARLGDQAVLRRPARRARPHHRRRDHREPLRGRALHRRQLARADAHRLRRPPALRRHLLQPVQGQLLHRRRLPPRRRRLLLDHRPGRRRHQRLRPPHGHGGGRNPPSSPTPRSPRPPSSAIRTPSRARASTPTSP